jgi:hypothetical protein
MITRNVAMALIGAAASIILAGIARAEEPRTIGDCEKIQAADAYNQCLAKFGPPSKLRTMEPERPGDVKSGAADAAGTAKPAAHRGRHARVHAMGGRKRARFKVSHRRHHG